MEIRRYLKSELARVYGVTLKTLMVEIKPLLPDLERTGYERMKKTFTPKQVRIIYMHLGETNVEIDGESGNNAEKHGK